MRCSSNVSTSGCARPLSRSLAFRRCALAVVTSLGLVVGAGCRGAHGPAATAEDSAYSGPDSISRAASDSGSVLPDSLTVAAVASPAVQFHAPTVPSTGQRAAPAGGSGAALSPLADTIAQYLVFDPMVQTWFLSAKRGKRLLVDIGRVDLNVQHDKRRMQAYLQAVKALSPLPIGTPVRVYDAWGVEDDTVAGFSNWNDRIVATLHLSKRLDSLVRHAPAAYAAIERTDTATPARSDSAARDSAHLTDSAHLATTVQVPAGTGSDRRDTMRSGRVTATHDSAHGPLMTDSAARADSLAARDSCQRDSLSPALALRAVAVRDSIDFWLRTLPPPPYERLVNTERSHSSQVSGCFGNGNRLAVAVDLRAGANEWIRERAVLIDTLGRVTSLRMYDYRFKGHDLLSALDPNGSGVDGIVARGVAEATGGIVILAFEPGNHLARWVSGFGWEAR
jgi:hypothetical protein